MGRLMLPVLEESPTWEVARGPEAGICEQWALSPCSRRLCSPFSADTCHLEQASSGDSGTAEAVEREAETRASVES